MHFFFFFFFFNLVSFYFLFTYFILFIYLFIYLFFICTIFPNFSSSKYHSVYTINVDKQTRNSRAVFKIGNNIVFDMT